MDGVWERASYTWSEDSIRLIVTASDMAKAMLFYTQEVGYFKTKPPYFTERMNLNSFLVLFTVSGKGILTYDGKQYEVPGGTCFLIDCKKHHHYKTEENDHWEILWLHFNGTLAVQYYQEFIKNGFQILEVRNSFFMESTLRRIIALNQKKDAATELVVSDLITHILTGLMVQNQDNHTNRKYIPDYIRDIAVTIEKEFAGNLTLDLFADKYHRSKFGISKEFKRYMGISLNEYHINVRISSAKALLRDSDLSVNEIAFEIGMNHVSHFINLFKARENMTPLQYRKEWLG